MADCGSGARDVHLLEGQWFDPIVLQLHVDVSLGEMLCPDAVSYII